MATTQEVIDGLKAKVTTLTQAAADREARDVEEERLEKLSQEAKDKQIELQAQMIVDLNAVIGGGGLTAQQVQDLTDIGAGMSAVQTSLEAADPTPPVVP